MNWYEEVRMVEDKEIDQYIEELEAQKDEPEVAALLSLGSPSSESLVF